MPGNLWFRWTGPFWIIDMYNNTFQLGTLAGEAVKNWVNGFRLTLYHGPTPPHPFVEQQHGREQTMVGDTKDFGGTMPQSQ